VRLLQIYAMSAYGRQRTTLRLSPWSISFSLPSARRRLGLFFSLMCCLPGRRVSTLPEPVIL